MKNIEQKLEKEVWSKLQKLEIESLEVEIYAKDYIYSKITKLLPESDSIELVSELADKTYNRWKVSGDEKSVNQIILDILHDFLFLQMQKYSETTEVISWVFDEYDNIIDTKSVWKN